MIAVYGLGATELLIILIIVLFFPAAIIVFALLKVLKSRNRDRIGAIESRLERLERQLDRTSEQIAPKQRE
jgi:hypothetical protein